MKTFIQAICFTIVDIPSTSHTITDTDFIGFIGSDKWKHKCGSDSYWGVRCRMNNRMIDDWVESRSNPSLHDMFYKELYVIYEDIFLSNVLRSDYPKLSSVERNNAKHTHQSLLLTLN